MCTFLPAPRRRGFTLVELIVVILILGILAAVGVVGYTQVTDRANTAAATANLRQITTAALAAATEDGDAVLTRALVLEVMNAGTGPAVVEGLGAAAWKLGTSGQTPDEAGEFALGFDNATDEDTPVDGSGLRAALVTAVGNGDLLAQVFTAQGAGPIVPVSASATPAIVLDATSAGSTTPVLSDDEVIVPPPAPVPAPTGVSVQPAAEALTVSWEAVIGAGEYKATATPTGSGTAGTCTTTATTCTVSGLVNGAAYLVSVTATVDHRTSPASDPVTGTPVAPVLAAKLRAVDGAATDYFGASVSVDGDTALIGAHYDDDKGTNSGSVYVFVRTGGTWTQQAKLVPTDGAASDAFGWQVALRNDTAAISAYLDDDKGTDSGSAYVFTRTGTTWTQQAKLLPADGAAGDQFAGALSLSGDTILAGAKMDDDKGTDSGSAYVFTRTGTTWTQQAKLVPADGASADYFATSVGVSDDTAVVGATGDDDKGADSGSAYVFTRTGTTWTQQAKLLPADGAAGQYFGNAVDVDAATIAVGAFLDDDKGVGSGSVYVYTRAGATWVQQAKLVAPDGQANSQFGYSVAIDAETVLVGAYLDDRKATNAGAAYVFTRTGTAWSAGTKLTASDAESEDRFGRSVALGGGGLWVSAMLDDDTATNAGAVWLLPRP